MDLSAWVERYADRRACGVDPAVRAAWSQLAAHVLRDNARRRGTFGSVFQGLPPLAHWAGRPQNPHQDYEPSALVNALQRLLDAGPAAQAADGYRFDVVNFTRQALCNLAVEPHRGMLDAFAARDLAAFRRESALFLEIGRDLDALLGTRREFLLGSWLAQARSWGTNAAEADYYEANAREILTSWHVPGGQLTDYASRQWNGLLRDYYLPRWEKWIGFATESLERGTPFPESTYLAWVNAACTRWNDAHDATRYAMEPEGDAVACAHRLFAKYLAAPAAPPPAAAQRIERLGSDAVAGAGGVRCAQPRPVAAGVASIF
jgi:alpha-N-acetylglucosaminidase